MLKSLDYMYVLYSTFFDNNIWFKSLPCGDNESITLLTCSHIYFWYNDVYLWISMSCKHLLWDSCSSRRYFFVDIIDSLRYGGVEIELIGSASYMFL
jgi:hypothetical protein